MPYTDNNATARAEYLAKLGVALSAQFIPQSANEHKDEKIPSLNWRVTITRTNGAHSSVLVTGFMQGIAYVPGYNASHLSQYRNEQMRRELHKAAETGRYATQLNAEGTGASWSMKTLPTPSLDSVLSCLLLDAQAGDDTFEGFCGDFGYDTDSRKAHETWLACVNTRARLARMFSADERATLFTLFEGF